MLGFTAGVAFFFALPAWLWARCLRRDNAPLGDALAFAALWLALELFRSWFLTGFPWLYAGYSQLQGPLAGLVPVGGVWLSSFVIALSAALLVNLPRLFPHGASLLLALVLLLGPWAAGLYLKGHAWTHSAGEPLKVVAIQGNIAQELKWDPTQVRAQLDLYRDLSLPQQDVDLIVWPETAVPILQDMASGYLGAMGQVADEKNGRADHREYRCVKRLADGKAVATSTASPWSAKARAPTSSRSWCRSARYVPLQDLLRGLIAFFDLPMSDFARGPADQALLKAKGYRDRPVHLLRSGLPGVRRRARGAEPGVADSEQRHLVRHFHRPFAAPADGTDARPGKRSAG
ncbi:apolipoprotein N-acyltransferase [Pseudomonas aeruginosa]|nr:apolipoprotein N-acyltransferase [Pseudomonas aeruginosa]